MKFLNKREKSIPTLKHGSDVASTNTDKANMLNSFFKSCFNTVFPPLSPIMCTQQHQSRPSDDLLCSVEEIYHLLSTLDVSKASGPDGISPRMLKYTAAYIAPSVTELFNLSITSGRIPLQWKRALVVPIPKNADHSSPTCYRPISLIPVISKVLERHLCIQIIDHLHLHDLISDSQWGFLEGRSTVTALLRCTDDWFRNLENGYEVCAVFFDFRKAFDSVPHQALLQKLSTTGLDDCLLNWLHNYLCDRTQSVVVEGAHSDVESVLSGVPQGSVLGPLLFLAYINDLTCAGFHPNSIVNLFADDVLLYHCITDNCDFLAVQESINSIEQWSSDNHLQLNVLKCKTMTISRKRSPSHPANPLLLNGEALEKVDSYKYLGLLLTADLSWSSHISGICAKARKILGLVYRRFYGAADQEAIKQLYISIVRPHLEYGCQIWDPHLVKDKTALENVQKFACRIASARWDEGYEDLLNHLNLQPLHQRRLHAKLGLLYKIIHKLCFFPENTFQERSICHSHRVTHQHQLNIPFAHSNSYLYSFVPHTISTWNSLPDNFVCAPSYASFMGHLRS